MPDSLLVEASKGMLYPQLAGKYDELEGEAKAGATPNTGRVFKQRQHVTVKTDPAYIMFVEASSADSSESPKHFGEWCFIDNINKQSINSV